jgi:hypothetical protein
MIDINLIIELFLSLFTKSSIIIALFILDIDFEIYLFGLKVIK